MPIDNIRSGDEQLAEAAAAGARGYIQQSLQQGGNA